ncbi:CapA family protein [Pseudomonas sp. NyZ480]|uniref:CapA family protein n=1 Tax=Pseudomonas sp. NyZ480 TaxID=3035289 RepID=UPI00240994EE|nr:CapA family protein [Pseudomonas sp. NyZ480]WEZ88710.1 CapA family protein [Pseudomonas sp. NyZ480]
MKIALTGDSILQRRLHSRDDQALSPLFDLIRAADVSFTNLEVLPNDFAGDPALESGGSHFGAPSWVLDELVEGGFDLFSTANNHSLDYGISGLHAAHEQLRKRELLFAGTGRNLEEARRPVYCSKPAGTVALLACSSTYGKGQEASDQSRDMPGRPGLNPLGYDTLHEVSTEQMAQVRQLIADLGLDRLYQGAVDLGFAHPLPDPSLAIFGPFTPLLFREGANTRLRTLARKRDLDGILRWVEEARLTSDIVLVSLHAHELGYNPAGEWDLEVPAEFIQPVARKLIDAGVDIVVGHGPHLLRGMEIYQGKPIFYSLGNFIGQNELVERLPVDSYEQFRVDRKQTPSKVFLQRTHNGTRSFPSDARFWESIVPICTFDGRTLTRIELHPVQLGFGEAIHRRGRPRLASGQQARTILQRFAALCAGFDTRLEVSGDTAQVVL